MQTMVLRNMKHYIRTAVGVSCGFIKFNWKRKKAIQNGAIKYLAGAIGGVGQGGGASPIIWMTVLMVLMKAYKQTQQGAMLWDCILHTSIFLYIISYVDDNTIVRHFHHKKSIQEIIQDTSKNLQVWQKILQIRSY